MTDDHADAAVGSDIAMPLARPVSVATFSDNLESRWRIPAARVHGAAMHGCPGVRRQARFPEPGEFLAERIATGIPDCLGGATITRFAMSYGCPCQLSAACGCRPAVLAAETLSALVQSTQVFLEGGQAEVEHMDAIAERFEAELGPCTS